MSRSTRTIYVGNLPGDIRESEIEDIFYKYGRILDVDLKFPPRPPVYAFVEFDDPRDAEDAVRYRDGYLFDGHRLRVEPAHSPGGRGNSSYGDRYGGYRGGGGGGGGRGVSRRTEFRVVVTGLPSSASWQDLKDYMRTAGDVCFAQIFRETNGTRGIVDFTNYEDMKNAVKKLDDTEFKNPFSKAYIRVREDKSGSRRSPSRTPSRTPSPRRSRTRSPSRGSRSPSPRRSQSPVRRRHSPSGSPVRRRRSPSGSPVRRRRSPSGSRSPRDASPRSKSPRKSPSRSPSPRSPRSPRAAKDRRSPSRSPSRSPKRGSDKSPAPRSPSPVSDGN